jgi:hypothetical protein
MTSNQYRQKDLKNHIAKNYKHQKELEDKLRFESDLKEKLKLKHYIENIKSDTVQYNHELKELDINDRESKRTSFLKEISDIGFKELDVVTKFIIGMTPIPNSSKDTSLIPITDKISKNNLTDDVKFLLTGGMSKVQEFSHFVDFSLNLDPEFATKLIAGFTRQYRILKDEGITGDELFNRMYKFSYSDNPNHAIQFAGLAVLSYLFERCEVFEK